MSIINEQFTISNVTKEQYKVKHLNVFSWYVNPDRLNAKFKKFFAKLDGPRNEPVAAVDVAPVVAQPLPLQPIFENLRPEQVLMIQRFSADSGLNSEWSKQ